MASNPANAAIPRADRIALPDDLDRGTYRVLKHVSAGATDLDTHDVLNATLKATFVVR